MPGKVQVSGTFRLASAIKVKVAGTWRNATQAYVKVAGDWRQWFSTGVVDTFSRTTTTNLGTSESSIPWASRFGTWTANGSVAVSSNAVSSGTAGALAYVDLANKNALTSVSTPNAGVGPAFWVTSAGSWWGAHLTSDQTNTTVFYNCNCTCNGHNETTCNTCTNAAFGTYSCPTTYAATGTTTAVKQGDATPYTVYTYVSAATPVYQTEVISATITGQVTTYSHFAGGSTFYRYCPGGESQYNCSGTFFTSQCYTLTYSCPANQYYNSDAGMCYWINQYGNYPSGATRTCSGTYYTASIGYNCDGLPACPSGYVGPVPGSTIGRSVSSCYCGVVSNTYSCADYASQGYTLSGANCTRDVFTGYSCSSPLVLRGEAIGGVGVTGCYSSSTAYHCDAFPGSYRSGTECFINNTTYSCPSGGTNPGNSSTCTIAQTCNNSGTSCEHCGSTTTFISGGTANSSTGAGCDSYGFTCQTCSSGSITNNYYLQIIYSTAGSAAYTVYSTSSMLASQPTSIQVSTGNNTATVTPYNGGTSLGTFTATNTGTKGNGAGIVKAYAGIVNQSTTVDNFSSTPLDIAPLTVPVTYLVVAAGGGGGQRGGGGGGGLLTGSTTIARDSATTVIVGAGGGNNGNNSVLGLFTAIGGGRGGSSGGDSSGSVGGSGGGGGSWVDVPSYTGQAYPGGAGTSGQGFAGGAGGIGLPSSYYTGGGGGGAAGAGEPGQSGHPAFIGGHGGLAYLSSITGTATYYAGGGGGFGQSQGGVGGIGGPQVHANGIPYSLYATKKGGAGNGANYQDIDNNQYYNPQGGQANTGGGAGGGFGSAPSWNSGSGVVIISYPTSYGLAVATTGSPTQTTAGSNYVYKFTGTGSITF